MSNVLTIAGMHRSGTSLTAMWLNVCGLDIGEDLMSGQFDNPKGHFEDLEIVRLHENDLLQKGLKTHGLYLKGVNEFFFEKETLEKAKSYLEERSKFDQWGWKEPRSTLYLKSWKTLIPNLKVVAVFRPYNQVVKSLLRRTKHSFLKSNKYSFKSRLLHLSVFPIYLFEEKKKYLDAWIRYNHSILDFKSKYPDDILIVSLYDLINKDDILINKINKQFGFNLNYVPIKTVFEENLMSNTADSVAFLYGRLAEARAIEESLAKESDA